ncbi:MAG: phosphodiester glycosidase family protein [Bacilli bacterium]|nr:phosphodiester glycosidase family protein [Bacilli bacterium]
MKTHRRIKIVVLILDILMCVFLFFTYGPISYFRTLLITTAMTTKSHHYLARTFYSDDLINKVLSENYISEVGENTNLDEINFDSIIETDKYESEYEKQILKHNKDDVYKIFEISGTGYKGFVAAIYDASRIELVTTKYLKKQGQFLQTIAKENEALLAINGGGFIDIDGQGDGGTPTGTVIQNSKILFEGADTGWGGGIVGFTSDNKLLLTKESSSSALSQGIEDAVDFGPFLIVNGKRSVIKGNGGYGTSSRTAIAQRQDGIVLFVVIDGRQPGYSLGVTMSELTDILVRYKAYNAVNLDGGASSSMVENGNIVNKPCAVSKTGERWIPTAWIVK